MKSHIYSLKASTIVKIARQCFENFGGPNAPNASPLVARLCSCHIVERSTLLIVFSFENYLSPE